MYPSFLHSPWRSSGDEYPATLTGSRIRQFWLLYTKCHIRDALIMLGVISISNNLTSLVKTINISNSFDQSGDSWAIAIGVSCVDQKLSNRLVWAFDTHPYMLYTGGGQTCRIRQLSSSVCYALWSCYSDSINKKLIVDSSHVINIKNSLTLSWPVVTVQEIHIGVYTHDKESQMQE